MVFSILVFKDLLRSCLMNLKGKIYYSEASAFTHNYARSLLFFDIKDVYVSGFDNFVKDFQPLGIIPVEDIVEQIRFLLNKHSTKVSGTSIFINAGRN